VKSSDAAPTTKVLVLAILISTIAFLEGTASTWPLPAIKRDLSGGLTTQQWVVDGCLLTLAGSRSSHHGGIFAADDPGS
jgi:hypothetical protein